ncbi:glycosyltransferase family 4 protein [Balneolaceae bacterium YR4-1]|uniref:Glycosyltransferase family 4 protein n=1 Tax=Halalkalibaculum roseum TaxID=2709311 RepID=A0A6M1SXR4_9BACT|nr:glycosyltransferase family 4 protein [Halalkalibaculum roseum]NGP75924.1 glycosyltransferase family 4 protein [Halalkalibaculum roseum]
MKVLHVFNEINYSGAELMYSKAAPIFKEHGIETYAVSTGTNIGNFTAEFSNKGINCYHRPFPQSKLNIFDWLRYYKDFFFFIKDKNFDVLHIHRNDVYSLAFIANIAGIPTIKTVHGYFKNRKITYPLAVIKRFAGRKLFNITFQTIGDSVYKNELDYYKNPSVKVNNWIDNEKFYPPYDGKEGFAIRDDLGIDKDDFILISVGSCTKNKNHHDILKAMSILPKEIDVKYLHLGNGDTEKEEKKLSKDLKIDEQVYFLGNRKNVRDYLVASDLFIMTSRVEGLGNAALEAMACGLPTILYNVPGLRDLIKENDNGFLIEENFRTLAEKILKYFNNPDLKTLKGNSAHEFVNKHFSMKNNAIKIIELYAKV